MTGRPLVSIIIPVYNGANYLRYAIDSALAQTYPDVEILVVDDGSNDDGQTERIARSYGKRIQYFAKANGGVSTALNEGLRRMQGDFFSWLSHDDVYYPTKVERQVEVLRDQAHSAVAFSDYDIIDASGAIVSRFRNPHVPEGMFRPALIRLLGAHGCSMLIHRSHFARVGIFNPRLRYTQDYDMWFRLGRDTRFICLPERLIQSRSHAEAGSVRYDTRREEYWLYRRALVDLTPAELNFAGDPAATYIALANGLVGSPNRCNAGTFAYGLYKQTARNRCRHLPMELRFHSLRLLQCLRGKMLSSERIGPDVYAD